MTESTSLLWLRRFFVLLVVVNVISFGPYLLIMGTPYAPAWLNSLIGPILNFVYSPAVLLAYAVANSDMLLFECALFALLENVLLAAVLAMVWTWVAGRRRRRTPAASSSSRTGADPA